MPKNNFPLNPPNTLAESGHEDREFFAFKTNAIDSGFDKRVCDSQAHQLLNQIIAELGGAGGTPVHDEAFNINSPGAGSSVQLINTSVSVGLTRTFVSMNCSSRVGGRFELKLGGSIIGVIETGAGNYNGSFKFDVPRTGTAGTAVTVDFVQVQGPANAPVSVSLQSTEL